MNLKVTSLSLIRENFSSCDSIQWFTEMAVAVCEWLEWLENRTVGLTWHLATKTVQWFLWLFYNSFLIVSSSIFISVTVIFNSIPTHCCCDPDYQRCCRCCCLSDSADSSGLDWPTYWIRILNHSLMYTTVFIYFLILHPPRYFFQRPVLVRPSNFRIKSHELIGINPVSCHFFW